MANRNKHGVCDDDNPKGKPLGCRIYNFQVDVWEGMEPLDPFAQKKYKESLGNIHDEMKGEHEQVKQKKKLQIKEKCQVSFGTKRPEPAKTKQKETEDDAKTIIRYDLILEPTTAMKSPPIPVLPESTFNFVTKNQTKTDKKEVLYNKEKRIQAAISNSKEKEAQLARPKTAKNAKEEGISDEPQRPQRPQSAYVPKTPQFTKNQKQKMDENKLIKKGLANNMKYFLNNADKIGGKNKAKKTTKAKKEGEPEKEGEEIEEIKGDFGMETQEADFEKEAVYEEDGNYGEEFHDPLENEKGEGNNGSEFEESDHGEVEMEQEGGDIPDFQVENNQAMGDCSAPPMGHRVGKIENQPKPRPNKERIEANSKNDKRPVSNSKNGKKQKKSEEEINEEEEIQKVLKQVKSAPKKPLQGPKTVPKDTFEIHGEVLLRVSKELKKMEQVGRALRTQIQASKRVSTAPLSDGIRMLLERKEMINKGIYETEKKTKTLTSKYNFNEFTYDYMNANRNRRKLK